MVTVLEKALLREPLIMKYTPVLKQVQETKKPEILVSGEVGSTNNLLPRTHFILLK